MNILELCLSPGLGGLELYVYRSAEALDCDDSNTVIVALKINSNLDKYFQEHSSIQQHYIKRLFHLLPILSATKLANIIDANNIDAIHMHWGKDLPLAVLAKVFSKRKPALVYTRQMMITRGKNDFYHNILYGQLNLLLTITKELESLCKKYIHNFSNKVTTLYYGVKLPEHFLEKDEITKHRKELGFLSDDFIIGLFGRLEKNKGQHLLIEALHKARKKSQNIKALIVGHEMEEGYRDTLKKQATELGVNDSIVFQDFVSKPQQLMQICDCVLLASSMETFGLVLPEAMRAGIAVIGSNSGGVPEIIEHNKTGLLFNTEDANSLYEQLQCYYNNPELKSRLATQGKKKADVVFNNETHFMKLEQHIYDHIPDETKC